MADYRDNIEIDLKDLFRYILKYWKVILLGLLIGAVIGACYGTVTSKEKQIEQPLAVADYRSKLTEKEASEVVMLFKAYNEYQKLYDEIEKSDDVDIDTRFELVESANQLFLAQNALSANAKAYYNSLLGGEVKNEISEPATVDISMTTSIRYIVLGALAGAFIVMLAYALRYILSPTLKTADDVRTAFQLPVIGTVSMDKTHSNSLVSATILASAKKQQANRAFIISSVEDDRFRDAVGKIKEEIKDESAVSIVEGLQQLADITNIESINEHDAVVLLERTMTSKYDDVAREIELCYNYGIHILGAVLI